MQTVGILTLGSTSSSSSTSDIAADAGAGVGPDRTSFCPKLISQATGGSKIRKKNVDQEPLEQARYIVVLVIVNYFFNDYSVHESTVACASYRFDHSTL